MKTALDPRHRRRQEVVKVLYAQTFRPQKTTIKIVTDINDHLEKIDATIEEIAPEFPIDKIHKVDLAILRLAVYELMIEKKEPSKVVIDEAVELAKEFGGDASPSFVNGALGKLIKTQLNL